MNVSIKKLWKKVMGYQFEIIGGHIVQIKYTDHLEHEQIWNIYLENIFWGGRIKFPMCVEDDATDRILWMYDLKPDEFMETGEYHAKGPSTGVVCVYTNKKSDEMYFIMFTNRQQMYKRFIHFSHRLEHVDFKKDCFQISFQGCVYSDKWRDFRLERTTLVVDQNHKFDIGLTLQKEKQYAKIKYAVTLDSIVSQETFINNPIHVEVEIDGEILEFNVGHKTKRKKPGKFYYVPIVSTYYENKALFVRGNINQNYTLVVRDKEPIEYDIEFLALEDESKSFLLYHMGRIKRFFRKIPVNLYYEKNSMKAEEGTFEIFLASLNSEKSRNYFILDKNSPQWEQLSKHPNVVAKYSRQYYELIYSADCFISTETPSHLNVHRALNKYVRKTLLEKRFVFLQHGVTYLKCQGAGSVFGKGKEGEPDYIVVGSEKEAKVVAKMLNIPQKRCVNTGLPVFDTIEYEHITEKSDDMVTIMMTWKPSEEHMLTHFEDSGYYSHVRTVYKMIQKYILVSQIQIVPHPKVAELIGQTDLAEFVWKGTVSEALKYTKLLITDYSSVCYNAFYQGAAVIFYQPDLEEYQKEVGKLVPKDGEYIGYRVTEESTLEQYIRRGIQEGHIDLEYLRSEEFVNRYRTINQYSDGNNIARIVEFLKQEKII